MVGHDARLVLPPTVSASEEQLRRNLPAFDDIALSLAEKNGVCVRPMVLKRIDTTTGRHEFIPVPCGATLESVCRPCARKSQRLRMMQCREGWHLDAEPDTSPRAPHPDQEHLIAYRADLLAEYTKAVAEQQDSDTSELAAEIAWVDTELATLGMRGKTPPLPAADTSDGDNGDDESGEPAARRHRSTRRRDDVTDLPRQPVDKSRSIGREYAGRFRPSMFITLTLDSYGPVHRDDGTPLDPDRYDYTRAAWDAVSFAALVDRWIQNLRRVIGWEIQYFAAVEPQRRGAPHIHLALRGTVPREVIREVTRATYRNIWWPTPDRVVYGRDDARPVWDHDTATFLDPDTREPLPSWDEAVDAIGDDDAPAHVARFGVQVHYKGILAGTPEADRHIGYLCKYLTKSVGETLEGASARQHAHYDRLHKALCATPCSPRCAVWLAYGIVPKGATRRMEPGRCKGRAHRRSTLGLPGRRVLCSKRWTGKTLGDHKADRAAFVRGVLAAIGIDKPAPDPNRFTWSTIAPGTRIPSRSRLLLAAIKERTAWRLEYDRALSAIADPPPPPPICSATNPQQTSSDQNTVDPTGASHVC
ncbi:replication initiator [Nocardia sp. N2S4-5]|uniref:replication initiator n=1 Tax=Nocardia sp. N2S4-5 TaxID=3351565 RepID=UPI0037D1DB1E